MRIFAGIPLGGDLKWEWGCRQRQFLAIWVATSSETSEVRSEILHGDMLPLVGLWLVAKWVTENDIEWLFHVKIRFPDSERLTFKNSCVKSNKHIPMLHGQSGATGTRPKLGQNTGGQPSDEAHKSRDFSCFLTCDINSHWAAINRCHARMKSRFTI